MTVVPSPAVLSWAALVLLIGMAVAIFRQRPLRLAIPGQIAVTCALAATFVYSLDEPRDGRATYVLSTLALVTLAYLLASGGRPLRFLPAAFLTGFPDEASSARHDRWRNRHVWLLIASLGGALAIQLVTLGLIT